MASCVHFLDKAALRPLCRRAHPSAPTWNWTLAAPAVNCKECRRLLDACGARSVEPEANG